MLQIAKNTVYTRAGKSRRVLDKMGPSHLRLIHEHLVLYDFAEYEMNTHNNAKICHPTYIVGYGTTAGYKQMLHFRQYYQLTYR